MYIMWFLAAVSGSKFDCEGRSGSLKERRCFEPDEIARAAVVFHEEVLFRPQSIGTNSNPDRIAPSGELPQLYAQVIPLPSKALVRAASLYERPRLSPVDGTGLAVGFGTAAEGAALEALLEADAPGDVRNVVGMVTAPQKLGSCAVEVEYWTDAAANTPKAMLPNI
jgi:hypothetical protein